MVNAWALFPGIPPKTEQSANKCKSMQFGTMSRPQTSGCYLAGVPAAKPEDYPWIVGGGLAVSQNCCLIDTINWHTTI